MRKRIFILAMVALAFAISQGLAQTHEELALSSVVEEGELSIPWGIEIDQYGNVFVLDQGGFLFKYDKHGSLQKKWEGFGCPQGFTITKSGEVFIEDICLHSMMKIDRSGQLSIAFKASDILLNFSENPDNLLVASPLMATRGVRFHRIREYSVLGKVKKTQFMPDNSKLSYAYDSNFMTPIFQDGKMILVNPYHATVYVFDRDYKLINEFVIPGVAKEKLDLAKENSEKGKHQPAQVIRSSWLDEGQLHVATVDLKEHRILQVSMDGELLKEYKYRKVLDHWGDTMELIRSRTSGGQKTFYAIHLGGKLKKEKSRLNILRVK